MFPLHFFFASLSSLAPCRFLFLGAAFQDFQAQMEHSLFGLGNLDIQPIPLRQVPLVVPVYSTLSQQEHYLSSDIWHTSIEESMYAGRLRMLVLCVSSSY